MASSTTTSEAQRGRFVMSEHRRAFLPVVTNGKVTSDGIGPHGDSGRRTPIDELELVRSGASTRRTDDGPGVRATLTKTMRSVGEHPGALTSLRFHWPEYLMEFSEMALYLFFTCLFATLLQHPV